MKTKAGMKVGGLVVLALPLFVAVGCAGNKQTLAQTDSVRTDPPQADVAQIDTTKNDVVKTDAVQQDDTVQTAIATMDGYIAELDQSQALQDDIIDAVDMDAEAAVTEQFVDVSEASIDENVVPNEAMIVSAVEALSPPEEQDVDLISAEGGLLVEETDIMPAEKQDIVSIPRQLVFYFDTNSDKPAVGDDDILIQHARYLEQHPSMVLRIRGHADNRGAKDYNQHLSEQRALNIAYILLAAGVSGEQLLVDGMGDDIPMADPTHLQANRRVEFTYMDSMVAQND